MTVLHETGHHVDNAVGGSYWRLFALKTDVPTAALDAVRLSLGIP